jgi:group I intron endonuclease
MHNNYTIKRIGILHQILKLYENDFNKMNGYIYCFENIKNNKKYFGYSNNIHRRYGEHMRDLKNNVHDNAHMQNVYNKYGSDIFVFYISELCDENILKQKEIYYIALFDTTNKKLGYNMTKGGDGIVGLERTWGYKISASKLGAIFSEEHIKNLSISHMGYIPTESQKEKLRLGNVGKKKGKNTSSKYVGVTKRGNRWIAYININRKQTNLGRYDTEIEAALTYDKKCWSLFNISSMLNFPERLINGVYNDK